MTADDASARLAALGSPERAGAAARFYKTGPGQYAEGDVFLGVSVPVVRGLAREFRAMPLGEVERLLKSPAHEARLLALLILVESVRRCDEARRVAVYDVYLRNTASVNNWALVDTSAPAVVGGHLADRPRTPLDTLAGSASLWERRIALVATLHFIRRGESADTLRIARRLLADRHDLIHKATGWMLREVGKRDRSALEGFLDRHLADMPRTALRYAIERFPADRRRAYLRGKNPPGEDADAL